MTYTLNNLIDDLEKQNQDLPVVISTSEHPFCFKTLYIDQIHLEITKNNTQSVKNFLILTKDFPVKDKQINIQKVLENHLFKFYLTGIREIEGKVYLMLDDKE